MWLGIGRGHDPIPDALRKGNIHQMVAMDMPKLAAAQAKFLSAISMW